MNLSFSKASNKTGTVLQNDVYTSYAYDQNGNMVQKTAPGNNVTTYTYNYENLLASITLPDDSVTSYVYCALGKRVMKIDGSGTLLYRPDGDNILLEQDANGNTITAYTYNPYGMVGNVISNRKSGTDSYYHYDAIGNVMDLTNSGETVVTTYNYDAFGNILAGSSANNKTGFQTKPFEGADIGLYYSRARYYDPAVGRFISSDPIGFAGGINLYVYCENNPVNWVDPEGLDALDDAVNFSAGMGDTILLGGTEWLRKQLGINDGVDSCSAMYKGGKSAGYTWDAAIGVASIAKAVGYEIVFWRYSNARGIGMNVLDKGKRLIGFDWHKFKSAGKIVNRPHIDIPGIIKHWPWSIRK